MTDSDNINIRLVPTFVMEIPEEDPIHHTESGSFNLTSTLIPLDMSKPMKDVNSGVTVDLFDSVI